MKRFCISLGFSLWSLSVAQEVAVMEEDVDKKESSSISSYSIEELQEMNLTSEEPFTMVFSIPLPTEVPLEVQAGESFITAAERFVQHYGLPKEYIKNITAKLFEELQALEERNTPLISVPIFLQNQTSGEEFGVNLDVYEDESIFQAVVRFCTTYGLNVYDSGKQLESIIFEAVQKVNKERSQIDMNETNVSEKVEDDIMKNVALMDVDEKTTPDLSEGEKKIDFERVKIDKQAVSDMESGKVKMFSLPVKIDEEEVYLDFYNGDHLGTKVENFCEEHGLNQTIAKKPIVEAVLKYTEEIKEQYPDSIWLDSNSGLV
eukprot:snap_masked-scaffold_6-processed-gene-14.13-mRNA-1 protein AED:1.00 eAED:1.00 QI:0/-1/0/0/-1/1/1/0/317